MISVQKVFELAINAKTLYKSMSRENRLEYLKTVCLNPTLDGLTLEYHLQSPFARLSNWKENPKWRIRRIRSYFASLDVVAANVIAITGYHR
ncbi:MAG: hypothetical protein ACK5WZ_10855 [Pseudobdellovibrionaceae bacterium]